VSDTFLEPPFVVAERYDVSAELGRGGFAKVYRAFDRVVEREVAIKILRDDVLTRSVSLRFSREMRVAARLEHPNILHVYDAGTWDDRMFYVMEYVRGPALDERLSGGPLPVDEALAIARAVGAALAFAHSHGVVHRDVKPANILLGPSGAMLGDFGIAQVLSDDSAGQITSTGLAVGTPQYMSPEQLCAEPGIDGRSDQYSLALICYEMLTGVKPHVASSVEALRALRLDSRFIAVNVHRPAVPAFVNDAIARALSATPPDRFRDMSAFLAALDGQNSAERSAAVPPVSSGVPELPRPEQSPAARRSSRGRFALASIVGVAAIAMVSTALLWRRFNGAASASVVDAQPVAALIAPATRDDSALVARVSSELDLWREVTVLPQLVSKSPFDQSNPTDRRERASRSGATVLLQANVTSVGDSTRWTLRVYDARWPSRVARLVQTSPRSQELTSGVLHGWVLRALVGPAADSAPGVESLREPILGAARAYSTAWRRVRSGDFELARREFSSAATQSPSFAEAVFWAAQMGAWISPRDPSSWRDDAQRAAASPGLVGIDSTLARGLSAESMGDLPAACSAYRDATVRSPNSFAAWYGLGQCQRFDVAVLRDPKVPGGLRFRSSHWSALTAYEKALERMPSDGLSRLFTSVPAITYASGNQLRGGVALPPDTGTYLAAASLDGDSVLTRPIPAPQFMTTNPTPESFSRALERGRRRLLDFTGKWITHAPANADAWFNRAFSLELIGALDAPDDANSAARALRRAEGLAVDDQTKARIAIAKVRLAARRGAFDEATGLAKTASTRRTAPSPRVAALLAPLAAFVGDVDRTSALLRTASETTNEEDRSNLPSWIASGLPPWLADSLRSFGVRATLGICDGLSSRRDALERDFREHIAAADLARQRIALLHDAYWAAVPCLGAAAMRDFTPQHPLEKAVAALDRGDSRGARMMLDSLNRSRRGMSVATVTEDALLAEVWIWSQAGDSVRARAIIRDNMRDLARMSPFTFDQIAQSAALSRLRSMSATSGK
jgi:serine/threonine-protein kinase